LNYQIRELAEIVARTVPDCRLEMRPQPGADQRTYRADFSKFARAFPQFDFRWTAEKGARDLARQFRAMGLSRDDLADKRYTRLKWLRHLLDGQRLDGALRWQDAAHGETYATTEQAL